jgi:hypothetical protein
MPNSSVGIKGSHSIKIITYEILIVLVKKKDRTWYIFWDLPCLFWGNYIQILENWSIFLMLFPMS